MKLTTYAIIAILVVFSVIGIYYLSSTLSKGCDTGNGEWIICYRENEKPFKGTLEPSTDYVLLLNLKQRFKKTLIPEHMLNSSFLCIAKNGQIKATDLYVGDEEVSLVGTYMNKYKPDIVCISLRKLMKSKTVKMNFKTADNLNDTTTKILAFFVKNVPEEDILKFLMFLSVDDYGNVEYLYGGGDDYIRSLGNDLLSDENDLIMMVM